MYLHMRIKSRQRLEQIKVRKMKRLTLTAYALHTPCTQNTDLINPNSNILASTTQNKVNAVLSTDARTHTDVSFWLMS